MVIQMRVTLSASLTIMDGLKYRYFFFDLDNTLTRSKSNIEEAHADILSALARRAEIIVVSGSRESVIERNLKGVQGAYHMLSQNGNYAQRKDGAVLWRRTLSQEQKDAIVALAQSMVSVLRVPVKNPDDLIEDRGSQVSYSVLGHHEDVAIKERFDPDFSTRRKLLAMFAKDIKKLEDHCNVEVRIGGTTCLDFTEKGKHKGYNVAALIEMMQWRAQESVYFGDALFPGGNDETVIGIVDTKPVRAYAETFAILSELLGH